jgi:hypothetical protein
MQKYCPEMVRSYKNGSLKSRREVNREVSRMVLDLICFQSCFPFVFCCLLLAGPSQAISVGWPPDHESHGEGLGLQVTRSLRIRQEGSLSYV